MFLFFQPTKPFAVSVFISVPSHQVYRTDPLRADSDGDGLNDFDELFKYSTNPMLTDSDQDGVDDGAEVRAGARAKEA